MKKRMSKLKVSARLLKKRMRRKGGMGGAKQCTFCSKDDMLINYKNATLLKNFLTERGKILSARVSGLCAGHQRQLAGAIKLSRTVALVPYLAQQA